MKPTCEGCGKSGHDVEFNIFGPFEFGKYCVPCEKDMEKILNKTIVSRATSTRDEPEDLEYPEEDE
tara:strand:+ start:190 stop:387 length:198 start_codon:yes stop_codon:yes gene_type:complete